MFGAIAMVGQKGGTGKTTTGVSIACELHARGGRVLVVDADPQRSASTWLAIGARTGYDVPTFIHMGSEMHRTGQLDALASGYDTVVIDCPSRIDDRVGATMRSALMYTGLRGGLALLPCGPAAVDVWALADTLDAVAAAHTVVPKLRAGVVLTRISAARTVLGAGARKSLRECHVPVLWTELRHRIAYQEAPASGMGVGEYQPDSPAASEVRELVDELMAAHAGGGLHLGDTAL
jgi:chromosome partitioning protein